MSGMNHQWPKELTEVRKASEVKRKDKEGANKERDGEEKDR